MPLSSETFLLEEHKSRTELREYEDERKASLLAKIVLVRGIKTLISGILPAVAGAVFLIFSVVAYAVFLKTWGFAAIDVVFIAMALALFSMYLKLELVDASKEKPSWVLGICGLLLVVAWVLADWAIFPKNSRVSELIDALWGLALAGIYLGWAGRYYLRRRKLSRRI